MFENSEANIQAIALHYVGNKAQEDGITISDSLFEGRPELDKILKKYFTKSFLNLDQSFRLNHHTNLEMNEVYTYSKNIFANPDSLLEQSINITQHLYNQSGHPHIKPGEVCVVYFDDMILDGEIMSAIGIFKSERKHNFLQVKEQGSSLDMVLQSGISTHKIDKGVLIFNTEEENGYRLLSIDSNNYDTQYWQEDFLNLVIDNNEAYQTKETFGLIKEFAHEVVGRKEDSKEEVKVLNKAVKYFEENDRFSMDDFKEQVIEKPEHKEEFDDFKALFDRQNDIQIADEFDISKTASKKAKKQVKSLINLDTNIQIKLNFTDPESADKFIEKG